MKPEGVRWDSDAGSKFIDTESVINSDSKHIDQEKNKRDGLIQRLSELDQEIKSQGFFSFGKSKSTRSIQEISSERMKTEEQLDQVERNLEMLDSEVQQLSGDLDSDRREIFSGKRDLDLPLQ